MKKSLNCLQNMIRTLTLTTTLLVALPLEVAHSQTGFYDEPGEFYYLTHADKNTAATGSFKKRAWKYLKAPDSEMDKKYLYTRTITHYPDAGKDALKDPAVNSAYRLMKQSYEQASYRVDPQATRGPGLNNLRTRNGFAAQNYFTEKESEEVMNLEIQFEKALEDARRKAKTATIEYRDIFSIKRNQIYDEDHILDVLTYPNLVKQDWYLDLLLSMHAMTELPATKRQMVLKLIANGTKKTNDPGFLFAIAKQAVGDRQHYQKRDSSTFAAIFKGNPDPSRKLKPALKQIAELCLDNMEALNPDNELIRTALSFFEADEIKNKWLKRLVATVNYSANHYDPYAIRSNRSGSNAEQTFKDLNKSTVYFVASIAVEDAEVYELLMKKVFLPRQIQMIKDLETFLLPGNPKNNIANQNLDFLKRIQSDWLYGSIYKLSQKVKGTTLDEIAAEGRGHALPYPL